MIVRSVRDLGLLLRQKREDRGWSQANLAERIGTSRHWVMAMESGKPTAEIGLVIKAISALNLSLDIGGSDRTELARPRSGTSVVREPALAAVDLDEVLANARGAVSGAGRYGANSFRSNRDVDTPAWLISGSVGEDPGDPVPDLKEVLARMTGKNDAGLGMDARPAAGPSAKRPGKKG